MSPRRRGASSRCPAPNRRMSRDHPLRPVRPKPRGASGPCRSQSRAPWPKHIYALAGSRICGIARRCAFTPAVGIVAARTTPAIGVGTLGPPSLRRSQHPTARSPGAPYLARTSVELQSSRLDTAPRHGPASRQRRPVRPRGSRHDRGRGARNDPLASADHAFYADGGRALRQPPRRLRSACRLALALSRAGRRSSRDIVR